VTQEIPEYVTAQGNVNVWWLPAIADQEEITLAEMTAGVDITCYLPTAWEGITAEQARGEQTRMCLNESFEVLGKIKRGISDFTYTYLPQAADADPANEVKDAMDEGTNGFVVIRYGLPAATAPAATQKVESIAAEAGAQSKATTGSDEFAPLVINQSLSASGPLVQGALVA
jgi:hypothetical protein